MDQFNLLRPQSNDVLHSEIAEPRLHSSESGVDVANVGRQPHLWFDSSCITQDNSTFDEKFTNKISLINNHHDSDLDGRRRSLDFSSDFVRSIR